MTDPALTVRDLAFSYHRRGPVAVSLADLELAPGEQMLLRGGSGSGKSTLLHLIAGLLDPQAGRVLIAGRDIHALRGARRDRFRGRSIGMIFQTFNLLHGFSALENVMAALMFSDVPRAEHRPLARRLLEQLGIDRPGADPDRLSVGQQQRVAVARAVACGPALVLADEPTASLDPDNAATAMDLIQDLCRQRSAALLCVSHDPAMSGRFQRSRELPARPEAVH
jgi:ABC-type lipoprotein export system ATPase subunit